jgi:hypothetical protein
MVRGYGISTVGLLLLLIGLPSFRLGGQAREVPPHDNSDWWSITGSSDEGEAVKIQNREIAVANFRVLGIDLHEDAVARLGKKLGETPIIGRGDASTGREQACYMSSEMRPPTFLIVEEGEVNSAFYLFNDATPWNGRDLCTRSKQISRTVQTASGLHLGQTPEHVIKILGKPSKRKESELSYFLRVKKRTSPDALARCRSQHSELNDKELHEDCDTYDLTVFISAKFAHSELVYLGVSTAETD